VPKARRKRSTASGKNEGLAGDVPQEEASTNHDGTASLGPLDEAQPKPVKRRPSSKSAAVPPEAEPSEPSSTGRRTRRSKTRE
jgi:hypothetical protein